MPIDDYLTQPSPENSLLAADGSYHGESHWKMYREWENLEHSTQIGMSLSNPSPQGSAIYVEEEEEKNVRSWVVDSFPDTIGQVWIDRNCDSKHSTHTQIQTRKILSIGEGKWTQSLASNQEAVDKWHLTGQGKSSSDDLHHCPYQQHSWDVHTPRGSWPAWNKAGHLEDVFVSYFVLYYFGIFCPRGFLFVLILIL